MAQDNGGLLNIDLDKLLGVTPSPVQSLLSNPERLESNKNIAGGLGFVAPIIGGYGKKSAPEIILESIIGAGKGRQGAVDTETKRFMTQQDIMKQMAEYNKLNQDITLNANKISNIPIENLKLENQLTEIQNKNFLGSIKTQAVKSKFKRLQEIADAGGPGADKALMELEYYANNPDKYDELQIQNGINNMEYEPGELSAARVLKLNVRNRESWSPEEEKNFLKIIKAPSVKEAADINMARMAAHREDPINVPYVKVNNVNEVINSFISGNKPLTKNQDAVKAIPLGRIEPNEQYPEGAFKANDGKIYAQKEWNDFGIEIQNYKSLDTNRTETNENIKNVYTNARTDADSAQYGARNVERTNLALERILDNPQKFEKLFSTFGGRLPIAINKATGKFFATESDAQDIVNMLNTIKGQQFTNEIQVMRNNNKTGGAVGNVSDKEVEMFQNMAANLRYDGSAEELWYQLNELRGQGKKTVEVYTGNFEKYYGKEQAKKYGINALTPNYTKEYDENWGNVISAARGENVKEKISNNAGFINPNSQAIMNELLGISNGR
jgi:hypothetical protein